LPVTRILFFQSKQGLCRDIAVASQSLRTNGTV